MTDSTPPPIMTSNATGGQGRQPGRRQWRGRFAPTTGRSLRLVASVMVIITSVSFLTVTSLALFTDLESLGGNSFNTATVIIDGSPSSTVFNVPDLGPGEEVVREFTVANTGSAQLRYALTSQTTEDVLASELLLTVRAGVTSCTTSDWDASGSQLYQGPLGDSTTSGGLPILGDAATGADAGDRVLNAAASEPLCLHVVLPAAATAQNTTTTATFNFLAEQTANN